MRIDLAGKIRNTQLLRYRPLLPMFEAVVNSFQAIEDAYASGVTVNPRIDIKVRRDGVLPDLGVQGKVDGFTISYFGYNLGLSAYVEIISYAMRRSATEFCSTS